MLLQLVAAAIEVSGKQITVYRRGDYVFDSLVVAVIEVSCHLQLIH